MEMISRDVIEGKVPKLTFYKTASKTQKFIFAAFWEWNEEKAYFEYTIKEWLELTYQDKGFRVLQKGNWPKFEFLERVYDYLSTIGHVTFGKCKECNESMLATNRSSFANTVQSQEMGLQLICYSCSWGKGDGVLDENFHKAVEGIQEIKSKGKKMLEFYEDEKGSGIRSNAKDEREFLDWAAKLISQIIVPNAQIEGMDIEGCTEHWEGMLKNFLPRIIEICCKYRGYKSEVMEQRILISGQILGGDPQYSLSEKRVKSND